MRGARKGILALTLGVVMLVGSGIATATEFKDPVHIRLVGGLDGLDEQGIQSMSLQITPREGGLISDLRLSGKGGLIPARQMKTMNASGPGESMVVDFDLRPAVDGGSLELAYELDGKTWTRTIDVSEEYLSGQKYRHPAVEAPMFGPFPGAFPESEILKPAVPEREKTHPPIEARRSEGSGDPVTGDKSAEGAMSRVIRVYGQVVYNQPGQGEKPAHGVSVRAYDEDWTYDSYLGGGIADANGNFDFTFTWSTSNPADLNPDLYMSIVSGNQQVLVKEWDGLIFWPYVWDFPVVDDFTGTVRNFQKLTCGGGDAGALSVVKSISRANIYLASTGNYFTIPSVDAYWPSFWDTPHYDRPDFWNGNGEIHIPDTHTWKASTHIHEYGHHWVSHYAATTDDGYCTYGYCDDPGWVFEHDPTEDCGHCGWCPEHENTVFQEGFPTWLADVCLRRWKQVYEDGVTRENHESIRKCPESGTYGGAFQTEGFLTALLVDIDDEENETCLVVRPDSCSTADPFAGYNDVTSLGAIRILRVVDDHHPVSAHQFIMAFKNHYPEWDHLLWETAMHNGFTGLDTQAPVNPPLFSATHPPNVPSSPSFLSVHWDRPSDDFSGIGGYAVKVNRDVPADPGFIASLSAKDTDYRSGNRSPGTYFITMRVKDNAGNWDEDYATYGPMIIKDPDPGDLRPQGYNTGWAYPVVPKDTQDATFGSVPADTAPLYGNTYWNASVFNHGEATIVNAYNVIRLDGSQIGSFSSTIAGSSFGIRNNVGPVNIDGGRHTFELSADDSESAAEPNEADNRYGRQWVWLPEVSADGTVTYHSAPPVRDGGWESVTDQARWYNCTGFNILTIPGLASPWVILAVRGMDPDLNVDLRLHDDPASAMSGYNNPLEYSARPAGTMDAVLVNAANRPATRYVAGVLNDNMNPSDQYSVQIEYGESIPTGVEVTRQMEVDEGVALFTFEVTSAGWHTIEFQHDQVLADDPVFVAWYGQDFTTGTLLEYDAVEVTNDRGYLRMDVSAAAGVHGLALWRDPGPGTLGQVDPYTLSVKPTPPDLTWFQPTGWDVPLVLSSAPDVTTISGPEPAELTGDLPNTYLNFSVQNIGPTVAPPLYAGVYIDNMLLHDIQLLGMGPADNALRILPDPVEVRGGRHVASLKADNRNQMPEYDEANNFWATQYVWRPPVAPFEAIQWRAEPPYRTAHWEEVTNEETLWYNCDGIKTDVFAPSGDNYNWGCVAVMPGEFSDVDIRLHEVKQGARSGFDVPLASSSWRRAESDFVLMNLHNTPLRQFEVGLVLGETNKVEDYSVSVRRSYPTVTDPNGPLGAFYLSPHVVMKLHEINFTTAGYYRATLDTYNPAMHLGFSLYGPDLTFGNKEDVMSPEAAAWLEPAGAVETFDFTVEPGQEGFHCLAVWKVGTNDGPLSGNYVVTVDLLALVDVPESEVLLVTGLGGIHPNPFNPQTTIEFIRETPGLVDVSIYDLAGFRVTNLVHERRTAGRHKVVWDGRDDGGRRVASGTYMVRMAAGEVRQTKKVMLVK